MKINLTKSEIEDIHIAFGELLDFFKRSKGHQKVHKKHPCPVCEDYKKIHKKFERLAGK